MSVKTLKSLIEHKSSKNNMDIDSRALPPTEATEPISKDINFSPKAGDETPKNEVPQIDETIVAELETLKIKNLELQKQKEHWKDKYDRDINNPKPSEIEEDLMSDEGKALKGHISTLEAKLADMENKQAIERLLTQYPVIKDKMDEFNEFRNEYPNLDPEKIAKIFLVEKGYTEQLKPRIGLEKPTSGSKSHQKSGFSGDEIKRLRETQPRRYQQMLRNGKINPDLIT